MKRVRLTDEQVSMLLSAAADGDLASAVVETGGSESAAWEFRQSCFVSEADGYTPESVLRALERAGLA